MFGISFQGAVEKQKLVYILNRDQEARLTISSPLEAHKGNTVHYSICGVDVGFDNPIFASIEQNYETEDETEEPEKVICVNFSSPKQLTFYQLDLGLNHVVRGWTTKIHNKSNLLITGNDCRLGSKESSWRFRWSGRSSRLC